MKDTLLVWKGIFTSPTAGFKLISPATKIGFPLLIVLVLVTIAGVLLIPVISSDAYREASLRSSLEMMEKITGPVSEGMREQAEAQISSPLNRNLTLFSSVLGNPVMMMIGLLLSALAVWVTSLIVKNGITFGIAFRLMIFTALILILQHFVKNAILLLADYTAKFNAISTMRQFTQAQSIYMSAAAFIPAGALPLPLVSLIDYLTDIFNIIYFVFLFYGVRALGAEAKSGTAWAPVVVLAACSLILVFLLSFLAASFM